MIAPWFLAYSGRHIALEVPEPDDILLIDIAHHLARVGRYVGAGLDFISVAQHSVHVSQLCPPKCAAWGLLHDAQEYVLGDVSTPLKRMMRELSPGGVSVYDMLEERWSVAISMRFGVPRVDVKHWDVISALTERRDNGPWGAVDHEWLMLPKCAEVPARDAATVITWGPEEAEQRFLARAKELGIK